MPGRDRWAVFICLSVSAGCAASEDVARPVDVRDIVEMRDLAEPDIKTVRPGSERFAWSPDGGQVAFVTRKASLATGKVNYELRLLGRADLAATPRQGVVGGRDASDVHVEVSSTSDQLFEHAIRSLIWLDDSRTIAFLGEDGRGSTQVYEYDVAARRVVQCTHHPQPIVSFARRSAQQPIVFVAMETVRNADDDDVVLVAGTRSLNRLISSERSVEPGAYYRIFRADQCGPGQSEALSDAYSGFLPPPLWLSPDSRFVLTRLPVHQASRAAEWISEYAALAQDTFFSQFLATGDGYFAREQTPALSQFVLLDVFGGPARALFDAPDGFMVGGSTIDATWSADGETILLGNTFLPLDVADSGERARRSAAPAVVELELRSGRITRIRDTGSPTQRSTDPLAGGYGGMTLTRDGFLQLSFTGSETPEIYRKVKGGWQRTVPGNLPVVGAELRLFIRQDPGTAPDIAVRYPSMGRERVLTDFNPQFRALQFGRAEILRWTSDGQKRSGTLLFPLGHRSGRRYPLVLQIYVAHELNNFIIDGPGRISSAFAAQALAAKGLAVLTLSTQSDTGSRSGLLSAQRTIETAIDRLADDGLVDRSRIGLIGFSGSGVVVQHLIAFSSHPIAAATIADAWAHSLFGYTAYLFGYTRPGMAFAENIVAARPWGEELATWVERDPSLHTDRIAAALRIEQYDIYVNPYWDIYALLRRQHKPAELVIIPDGKHQLRDPRHRLASLQGNVDWFSYWLKDEVDADPAKAKQYQRWRQMRDLRDKRFSIPRAH